MLLEQETFEVFGYYPRELTPKNNKLIIIACELCGKFRVQPKSGYHTLCKSCCQKGNKHCEGNILSEDHKRKIGEAMKGKRCGEKSPNFGKRGAKSGHYTGGRKVAIARMNSKRRKLGTNILMPLTKGEVEHHVTNEYIIGIPEEVHRYFSGYKREKHRALILEWLKTNDEEKYEMVIKVL